MQNVVLVIHLLLALSLIAIVLLQRSEGGGLGMGGGGGGGGLMTGRQAASALSRMTWALAVAFIVTSLVLTVLTARQAGENSVAGALAPAGQAAGDSDAPPSGEDLLPPAPDGGGANGPAAPPPADSAITPPAAE